MTRTLLLCVAVLALTNTVLGAVYNYYPSSTLRLGGGFNPEHPDYPTLPCIDYDGVAHVENKAAVKTEFSSSVVENRQELYHQLNIDVNLSASFAFGSGSASLSIDNSYHFASDDLVWVLKASSDYGRFVMLNPRLNKEAAALASMQDLTLFGQRCGYEFVNQERRVAQVTAVFVLHKLSESEKSHITAAISGSGTGWDFSAKFNELKQSAKDVSQVTVNVYGTGGEGVQLLSSITSNDNLDNVRSTVEDYVSKLSSSEAVPIEYVTGSWNAFGVQVSPINMSRRNIVLPELYFTYRDMEARLRRLGQLIRQASESDSKVLEAQVTKWKEDYAKVDGELTAIS